MPKTSVHEYCKLSSGKGNIRFAGCFLPMKAVASNASRPQSLAQLHFWLGVRGLVTTHVLTHRFIGRYWRALVAAVWSWFCHVAKFGNKIKVRPYFHPTFAAYEPRAFHAALPGTCPTGHRLCGTQPFGWMISCSRW